MSDTETAPQGGGEAPAAPDPAAPPTPVETGAAPEPTETKPDESEARAEPSPLERRVSRIRAQLSAERVERERLSAELDTLRRAQASQGPADPERLPAPEDLPRIVEERVAAEVARRAAQERAERFHEAGKGAYPDWQERCQNLMQMGADAGMAELLIELPDGAKIAGALADDPEELERIAGIRTERGRAIALGKYAATIEARPPPPKVSRAPAPIRPISGTARVEANEYSMTPAQLVEHYSREAMAARRR